ncbi:MAG TPA: hypothetical protein PLM15_06490 [Methanothrix soehngenii]|nr:hypothetical protein [Methanothrix soehngenii]
MPETARPASRKAIDNEVRLINIGLVNIGFVNICLIIQIILSIEEQSSI